MTDIPLLSAEQLTVGYRKKTILKNLSFTVSQGCLIALVGKNGVGKSTLIRTLTRTLDAISGEMFLHQRELTSYSRRELASKIAVVTTEPLQVGALTVRELVSLGRDPHTGITGRLGKADIEAVNQAMNDVQIAYKADSFVAHLSDGERQKALIARALAQDTPLIILDEPFSFLDVSARIEILRMLQSLCHNNQRTVIYSSHDISQALRMADMIWMITPQKHLISGTPKHLIDQHLIDNLFDTPGVKFEPSQNDFVSC